MQAYLNLDDSFPNTIYPNVVLTLLTVAITHVLPFHRFAGYANAHPHGWWYYSLFTFALLNNSYQVLTHLLTAIKFLGIAVPFTPGGAMDVQTPLTFNVYNQLDLWGWWAYFLFTGKAPLLMNLLAAEHSSVGIVSVIWPRSFQNSYIIGRGNAKGLTWARAGFVTLDAIVRMYAVVKLVLMFRKRG